MCIIAPGAIGGGLLLRVICGIMWLAAVSEIALVLVHRRRRYLQSLSRNIDQLVRSAENNGTEGLIGQLAANWGLDKTWQSILGSLYEYVEIYKQRLTDAEHGRESAEVRLRRLTNDCSRMQGVIDALPDPVLVVDQFDELALSNTSANQLFRLPDSKGQKRAIRSLIRCPELFELLCETRQRKTPSQLVREITIGDGPDARPFRVKCSRLADTTASVNGDTNRGVVAVLTDISFEKAMQKRNAEFVASVSHEMKTPLTGIKAYVELLADGEAEDEDTRHEFLDVIDGQADRLQRLVENLLNIARIEAGVVDVNKQPESLNDMLAEAMEVVQPAAEQKGIELDSDFSPMFLSVLIDRDMMLQGTINLLSNAVKYTPAGGHVTLRSRLQDNRVILEVEDNGVGLSEEDCRKVFERFYRVKKERNMASGTGLGLSLVKHIVEDVHGGQIELESESGQGSTFRIILDQHFALETSLSPEPAFA